MALRSPRFASNRQLAAVAANEHSLKQGDRSIAMHLVQFALLDLGHRMPRSIAGLRSPDGSYGSETLTAVKSFQRARGLKPTGVVDGGTLGELDEIFRHSSFRARIHLRILADPKLPPAKMIEQASRLYGQYGIDVEHVSTEEPELDKYEKFLIDIDERCGSWRGDPDELNYNARSEYVRLHQLGSSTPTNEVEVYLVRQLSPFIALGCGAEVLRDRPAVTLSAEAGRSTLAHELGHLLLGEAFQPMHHAHPENLMFMYTSDAQERILTGRQVEQMRRHACCLRTRPLPQLGGR